MKDGDRSDLEIFRKDAGRGEPLYADEPQTLADLFADAVHKHPENNSLNFKRDGRWHAISAAEMLERIEKCALGLYSLGLRKGDRAAILAPNSPEWTIADAGCQFVGIVDVPIYTTLARNSVEFILNDSGARVLFLENNASYQELKEVINRSPSVEKVVLFRGGSDDESTSNFKQLLLTGSEVRASIELINELCAAVSPEDIATLIYTSGTTGEPKGVMLTHNCIISNLIDAGEKYDFATHDIPLSVLPLSHIFERSAMYLYLYHGMSVHYAESVDKVAENLAEVRPTIFIGVPRIFEKVYAKAKLKSSEAGGVTEKIFDWAIELAKRYALKMERGEPISPGLKIEHLIADKLVYRKLRLFFGGRLRACITGGAALSEDIYLIFNGAGILIMQGYGLTETSPVLTSNNPESSRLGSVGRAIRNVQLRIAEDGEIEAKSPGVMLGYYKNPAATREAFTDDGWFKTGDIGHIDEDGFLFVTDRKKELFKTSGGKYIAPAPIEQKICSSRFVNQVVLVGNEHNYAVALIVPNFEMLESYAKHKGLPPMTPSELCRDPRIADLFERQVAAATQGLARYETVKKIALLDKEFSVAGGELTPTLKIKRRVVNEKYRDVIDRLYAEK
jgi:long-chain acyl-CoA synthetase